MIKMPHQSKHTTEPITYKQLYKLNQISMFKKQTNQKVRPIVWTQFTHHHDAIFRSLHREISIGVLSVATLMFATPASATAEMSCGDHAKSSAHIPALSTDAGDPDDGMDSILLTGTEVVATRVPIPADKAVRLVQVLTTKEIQASAAQSVNDLLKLVAGVDVRQRGGFGIQTDIGINGGNEDQLTIMLNGVNISNPHTGHLSVDLPVSVNDIERIEVLEGGASRVYGSSAFSGVINIVTKSEKQSNISASAEGGSYGTWGLDGHVNLLSGHFANRISGGWSQSDGASANSDFKRGNAYWNERYSTDMVDVKFQAGLSTMKYGANTFYGTGSTSQWEEDTHYILSLQAETKGRVHVTPQVYWNRCYDHYVWTRSNPSAYQNYHLTNVYGANVNAWTQWALGKTALGFEFRRENILSTRLGKEINAADLAKYPGYKYKDGRSNYGIYLEHDIILSRWSISLGVLANKNTSVVGGMKFYPGVDVSYSPMDGMRVYASFNQSLRCPTYTDLYYNGPGITGNSALKPEKSTDFALGWSYRTGMLAAQVKGFYRKETDMIDWVKEQGATTWTTANSDIDNIGVSASANLDFTYKYGADAWLQKVALSYCHIYQHRVNEEQTATYASELVYLRNKFVASINHRIVSRLSAQWELQVKDRTGWFDNVLTGKSENYGHFAQLDLRIQWAAKHYTLYLKGNNLTNHKYYDKANIQQPGFWFMGGAKIDFDM